MRPVLVLGIGNTLLSDEGVGVRVVEALATRCLPDSVELIDGGTAGADLVDLMADRETLLVIDAVDFDAPPGSVACCSPDELLPAEGEAISLHQLGLLESLRMAEILGCAPRRTRIIAIQPAVIAPGLELSAVVAEAVPPAIAEIERELHDEKGLVPCDDSCN